MWDVSDRWLSTLTKSHGRYTRMELWFDGDLVMEVPVESGSVSVNSQNRIRRITTVDIPESFWPSSLDSSLMPYGGQLRIWQGITALDRLVDDEVPIFTGRVETIKRDRRSGKMTVTGSDLFADVNDTQFENPRVPTATASAVGNIQLLVAEVFPSAGWIVDSDVPPYGVTQGIMWDTDRGKAIDDLAAGLGCEVFVLPDASAWRIRNIPVIATDTEYVLTLKDGSGGTIVKDQQSYSRIDVANRIIVHVEVPGNNPFSVTVTDDLPSSPTRFSGPYGQVVRHISNPLIATSAQAVVAGNAKLARSIGATRARTVDMVPNPALEGGDVMRVDTADGIELHIADQFNIPFEPGAVMSVQTRSTATSVSDF